MIQKQQQSDIDKNKVKIVIVDDHPIVRQGLANLINQEKDLEVCAQAEDAHQAMESIKSLKPDMAIVDISLKETGGIELVKDIKNHFPNLFVLVLSMHDEFLYAERALRAGAKGYIMKKEATENVIMAIRKILDDQIYLSDAMTAQFLCRLANGESLMESSSMERLSDRELEVFHLIGRGRGTRQIAEELHLSIKTIETYREHIKKKLNLADATELLHYAFQWVKSQERE